MADLLLWTPVRVLTDNAAPGAGYRVSFFQSGTTTPVTVYSDKDATVPLAQPLAADSEGKWPQVFSAGGAIKAVITDPDGATVDTIDPVFRTPASASGAEEITFSPTVTLPFTNVQAAIEGAAATAASGFTPFGLGVTGSTGLLANLDATNIASGAYRFDGTTTGTFPTGVAASNTGIVETWRETSGAAVMFLYPDATPDRVFFRRMASSTWGTWREAITVNQGAAEGDILYRGSASWTRLAKGTAGQILAMNNAATAPEWTNGGAVLLNTWTYSTNVTAITFNDLGAWDEILLEFRDFNASASTIELLVSFNNGSTFANTGYSSAVSDGVGTSSSTTGLRFTRGGTGITGHLCLSAMASGGAVMSFTGKHTDRGQSAGGQAPAGAVNAIRVSGSTFTAGRIRVFGIRKV